MTDVGGDGTSSFKQARLAITLEGELVRRVTLQFGKSYLLGRQANTAITLSGDRVSRRHASFELRGDGLHVTDLSSANGVLVSGMRIRPETPILVSPGQRIDVADYQIDFKLLGFTASDDDATRRFTGLIAMLPHDLELLGQLGCGSTGSVWAALDKRNHRRVAVKVLDVQADANSETGKRFLREAAVCRRVSSFNVVEVYDVQLLGGQPVILMELVNGPSALERLRACDHRMPIPEVLRIGEHVARGLVAVAASGVVHRDVKPSNILLSPAGAKLSDFGIAKWLDAPSITASGFGMGTLAYVAPEQAVSAKTVDPRADIYSLGATLYHLLSGQPPFDPKIQLIDLFDIITTEDPEPLKSLRAEIPTDVAELVHAMLAKAPGDRPEPVAAIALELNRMRMKLTTFVNSDTQEMEAIPSPVTPPSPRDEAPESP